MITSDDGIKLITSFEGFRDQVYDDVAGYPTIGYGHLIKEGEDFSNGITQDQGIDLLKGDLAGAESAVNDLVTVELQQCQFDALVSFTYNLGKGSLESSTLLKLLNAGQFDQVPAQFLRWDEAGGKVVAGLERRRQAESNMFSGLEWDVA